MTTYTIKLRRDTAANWAAINPVLAEGEFGYEQDTGNFKIGDGFANWNTLLYVIDVVTGPEGPPGPGGAEGTVYVDRFTATAGQTDFVTSNPPTGELLVYRNGLLQRLTTDYTVVDDTITFTTPALVDDAVTITYGVVAGTAGPPGADGAEGASYIDYLTATAGQTDFVTSQPPTGVISVFRNGLLQRVTTDYTVLDDTITLTTAALVGDAITLMYGVVGGTAGPQGPPGNDGDDGAPGAPGPAAWTTVAAWAASTAYTVGPPASVVTYSGETYVCTTSHTSTSTFDATKWTKIAAKGADGSGGSGGGSAWSKVVDNALTSLTGFTAGAGAWTASASGIRQATTGNSRKVLFLDQEIDQGDFEIEAEVKIDTSTSTVNGRIGFLFDGPAADTQGGVSVLLVTSGSLTSISQLYFEQDQMVGGPTRTLPTPFATGVWKKFRVHKAGRHFAAYVDDVLVGQANLPVNPDAMRDIRRIALYSYEADCSYRNLKVWTPTSPAGGSGERAVRDRRWVRGTTAHAQDEEFNTEALNPAFVRVDSGTTGSVARVTYQVKGDSLSVLLDGTTTQDAAAEMHGLVKPYVLAVGEAIECHQTDAGQLYNYNFGGLVVSDGAVYGSGNQVYFPRWQVVNPQDGIWSGWNTRVAFTDRNDGQYIPANFFRIWRSATSTWQYQISPNGIDWVTLATRTLTMSPTHIGFAFGQWGGTGKRVHSMDYLRVVTP